MSKSLQEKEQLFMFEDDCIAIKYDDGDFYKNFRSVLYGGKGVDFVVGTGSCIELIEVKDFRVKPKENSWRVYPKDKKRNADIVGDYKHSLDIEVAQKVAMTIACMYGWWGRKGDAIQSDDLGILEIWSRMNSEAVLKNHLQIVVILHVDGIRTSRTRSEKMILQNLRIALKNNLQWLKCFVVVQNNEQANKNTYYSVR